MRSRLVESTIALVFCLTAGPMAFAQDLLFQNREIGDGLVGKYPQLPKILQLPTTISGQVGKLSADLAKSNGTVTFQYGSVSTRLKTTSWRPVGDAFSWSGAGVDSRWDSGCLLVSNNTARGSIYTEKGVFTIEPIGDDLHAVVSFDANKLPPDHGALPAPPQRSRSDRTIPTEPGARTTRVPIRVLVAFAKGAAQMHASPAERRAWLDDVLNVTNCSYINSGVEIELVRSNSSPLLVNYQEFGFTTDLNLLMGENDGEMDDIHAVRISDKADLVVLIVGKSYGFCGRAAATLASKEQAFAIVRFDCAKERLTFAHEVGHLQGASHQDEEGEFTYGHGFCVDGRGTVMSSGCGRRYPQWSRPPNFGSAERENNMRVLNQTAEMMRDLMK